MLRRTLHTLAGLLLWLSIFSVFAHELQANRLTLVLRERNHLAMTFFINYADALHRALAPQQAFQDFVLVYAAMPPEDFQKNLQRAQDRFQAGTHLTLLTGKEARITQWTWPAAARVQASLQEQAMQLMVAPQDHLHEEAVEIRAEIVDRRDIGSLASLTLRLPVEFQKVLVVSYRPRMPSHSNVNKTSPLAD